MHPELHMYLDGELALEDLSPDALSELTEWDALDKATSVLRTERAPADLEWRVMRDVVALDAPPVWKRALQWLVQPQPIRLRPAAVFAAAAVAAVAIALPRPSLSPGGVTTAESPRVAGVETSDPNATVYVQFVLATENARSVSVAGDFNGWQPADGSLRDPDGDGVWTGLIAVQPGLHKYMFVVDGEEWVTDPRAERYVDDGFGMRNALIAIAPPPRETRS